MTTQLARPTAVCSAWNSALKEGEMGGEAQELIGEVVVDTLQNAHRMYGILPQIQPLIVSFPNVSPRSGVPDSVAD